MKQTQHPNWHSLKGWEATQPGWYEHTIYVESSHRTVLKYFEIIDWLYTKLDNCEKHCRWIYHGNYLRFKFRYEREYIWFKLRWG